VSENRGLTGKIAIVFGGSRGIGAAAARRLAREGADVTVTYVSAPEQAADTVAAIEATGRTGLAIKADSADPAAIKAAVAQTVDHFGKLDIAVVNWVGIHHRRGHDRLRRRAAPPEAHDSFEGHIRLSTLSCLMK
jgi:3-oxoacyl-[acyl-carrier protein] reductase